MRYHLVQIGEVAYGVAHGHAAHMPEYKEWYRRISRRYLTPVGLIHVAPAHSCSTHSTSSSMSSQRSRRIRTDVPGPSVSYRRVDADVPYFQYGSTSASYDPGIGSGMQADEEFSSADDIPQLEDLGDIADVPPRRNPTRRRRPLPCGTMGHFL
ncbi:hypothetical protein O6P43_022530 [Quillaja saponaria]|uniref:Uncharacterized protein n=1 Tax=Quillaja saponaria TaxID=32244 RepID=A0AAD7LDB2_QUISA|nr:hypothetical protein O6P43_022530 [Quillaja saponaria]